jgi:hypothetical protein
LLLLKEGERKTLGNEKEEKGRGGGSCAQDVPKLGMYEVLLLCPSTFHFPSRLKKVAEEVAEIAGFPRVTFFLLHSVVSQGPRLPNLQPLQFSVSPPNSHTQRKGREPTSNG